MQEYSFVCVNGFYALVRTKHPHVAVWGIGSRDRKATLKAARDYCKNMFAVLHVEA